MGKSMEKYGFDKRIAYLLLGRCMPGTSVRSISIVIALASFILSMWVSNTSATAILTAVTLGILASLNDQISEDSRKKDTFNAATFNLCLRIQYRRISYPGWFAA